MKPRAPISIGRARGQSCARNDGVIDPREFEHLRADGFATMAAIQTLLAELATMVREIPAPVPLRKAGAR